MAIVMPASAPSVSRNRGTRVQKKVTKQSTPKVKRDEVLTTQFHEFFKNEWKIDYMYTPSDFITPFKINRHLARYYLMDMVWEGLLFRVKYANKTFYGAILPTTIDLFNEFIWMGVEVLVNKKQESSLFKGDKLSTKS
jgi:hypothetical protein